MVDPIDGRDGTFCSFQGHPVSRCTFVLARGYQSSQSTIEVNVSTDQPIAVDPANLGAIFAQSVRGTRAASVAGAPVARPALRHKFEGAGFLVMEEVVGGKAYTVQVGPLFVIRAEEVRRPDGSPVGRVRLTLEDVRYLWSRGLLARWSINRRRPDGSFALDSTKPGGDPFSRGEVAQLIVGALPGKPRLAAYPGAWDLDRLPLELPRFGAAVNALQSFVNRAGLEPPCLRFDGSVALHAPGDGKVAAAKDGIGPNAVDIVGHVLDKDGTGRGRVVEPVFAEEFVLVVGGERIATVALDDWQPVLVLPGNRVVPLDEAAVRQLTKGKFGLEWLKAFVLRPTAYQHHPDLPPEVGDLFADQAWQLFRMPGVELEVNGARAPGPNAHLLPMRPCAEVVNGRRAPAIVEAYSFTTQHVKLAGTPAEQELAAVRREIAALRASAPGLSGTIELGPNGEIKAKPQLHAGDVFIRAGEEQLLNSRGVTLTELDEALTRAREIAQYEPAAGGKAFAKALTDLTKKQIEGEEAIGGPAGRSEVFEAALLILEAEKELRDEAGFLTESFTDARLVGALNAREDMRQALISRITPLLVRADQERAEQKDRIETTGSAAAHAEAFGVVVLSNRPVLDNAPRPIDTGARIVDSEAGIVRTSGLAGWVAPNGAADPSYAKFVPRAVRVRFGVVIRPQVDVPPTPATDTSGTAPSNATTFENAGRNLLRRALDRARRAAPPIDPGGGHHIVPEVLSDQGTYYTRAFRRTARATVEVVPIDSVPLERAVKLDHPDMVELVPLEGDSNLADLDRQAETLARERANVPDVVTTTRVLFGRPWPVNPDGVVSSVTITMRLKDGAPCGFETLVTTGTTAAPPVIGRRGDTVSRTPANVPRGAAREGLT